MFTVHNEEWPSLVAVTRPNASGGTSRYEVTHDVLTDGIVRDCQSCGVRILSGPVYRDTPMLCVWHRACFVQDMRTRCAPASTSRWWLVAVEWAERPMSC